MSTTLPSSLIDLGVHPFRFAMFPESPAMNAFNQSEACYLAIFSTPGIKSQGSAQIILQDYVAAIYPDDVPHMAQYIEDHFAACQQIVHKAQVHTFAGGTFRARPPGGEYRWYTLRSALHLHLESGLVLAEGAFLDITAEKTRELELEVATQTLRREVMQRTHTEKQLAKALADLQASQHAQLQQARLAAVGDMAAGIAHDFNNLLVPIAFAADTLIEITHDPNSTYAEPISTDLASIAGDLAHISEDGARLVRSLRAMYQQVSDENPVHTIFDASTFLHSLVRLTQHRIRANARGCIITVDVDPGLELCTSESHLRQALLNLVLNAADAMAAKQANGSGKLRLRARRKPDEGAIQIDVRDDGIGMSPQVLERCKERHFSTKGSSGSGLGLANSIDIIKSLGGEIWIRSVEQVGTQISVLLPAHSEETTAEFLLEPTLSFQDALSTEASEHSS